MTALLPLALQNVALLRHLASASTERAGPSAVARAIGRDASNVGKSLKALADAGLAEEEGDYGWYLTDDGKVQLAMLDRAEGAAAAAPDGFVVLRHDQIEPDPDNARKSFDAEELAQLADTLASHGMLQKPTVWLTPEGRHQLTMGERRWRAWGLLIEQGVWDAGHTEPCMLETADDRARMEAALIENLQRVDLNHMEVGQGFELLGSRFHLANDQIARKCGRTKEYVQQHRRLTKLDDADQDRMRRGELAMHDALRIVARPSAGSLTKKELLIFAEIVLLGRIAPAKFGPQYYGGSCECGWEAADDPTLKALRQRRVLEFDARHYQTRRCYVSVGYEGREFGRDLNEDFSKAAGLPARLHDIRVAAVGMDAANAAKEADRFVTPWLNGPFELHPDAAKALEADKAFKASEREAQKKKKAAREAALRTIGEVAERALDPRHAVILPADDALPDLFKGESIAFPLTAKNNRVVDAGGQVVCDANWRFGENGERVAALLALALNLARGRLPASLENPEPIDGDAAEDAEGEDGGDDVEVPGFLRRLAGADTAAP